VTDGMPDSIDDCLIGYVERYDGTFPLYDRAKVLIMMVRDGRTHEEALEFYDYNYLGSWTGRETPGYFIGITEASLTGLPET